MYIIEVAINTPRRNVRQARQIKNSLSISKDKIGYQSPKLNTSDLLLELSYLLIDKFWDVFRDEISTERLSTYKNMDEYENIVRYFHAWLALFVQSFYYDKFEIVFCSTMSTFYHFMNRNEKIALIVLFENLYNWIET